MKQSKYWLKIICGYRKEQEYTINANEAHKAYYLFNNPEKRGTFDNGLALKGADIQRIVPDYNTIMGWNETYQLTNDDWNDIKSNGIEIKMITIMSSAKEIAKQVPVEELAVPLIDLVKKYPELSERSGSNYSKKFLDKANNK